MAAVPESTIAVVAYDSAWPGAAAEAMGAVVRALGPLVVEIEHIGSTAVPGLAAKPIIDLMAATADLNAVAARAAELAPLGLLPHHNGMTDRLLFVRKEGFRRTHHLHVVSLDSWPTRNQRFLRDHLRAHPADAARYAALKYAVAADAMSADDYTRAKTDLIQELTDRARAERGLPSVPVWEK